MLKSIGSGILVLTLLAGCGARDITQKDIDASASIETAKGKCYDAVAAQAQADTDIIQSLKESDRTMVTIVYLNNKQTATLVSAVTGHSTDRCSGTNLFDFLIAETEAKNKALVAGMGHGATIMKWVAGAWTASEIVSNIGTTNTSSGFSSTYTTNESKSRNTETRTADSNNDSSVNNTTNPAVTQ